MPIPSPPMTRAAMNTDGSVAETTMKRNVNLCLLLCATWAVAQPVVLKTSTILDGKGNVLTNRSIVIEDGKISRIAGPGEKANYDLSGLTVMPGWIDTH